jgi:hypothetical protein
MDGAAPKDAGNILILQVVQILRCIQIKNVHGITLEIIAAKEAVGIFSTQPIHPAHYYV